MYFNLSRRHVLFSAAMVLLTFFSLTVHVFPQNEDKDPVKLFNQGQDAHEKGDLKTALKFYEEAITAYPEFPEAQYQRGTALVALGLEAEAEKAFRRALELRADWNLPTLRLGELLVRTGRFPEAETFLTKAIRANETDPAGYVALTELRLKTKASPEVLKELLGKLQAFSGSSSKPNASIWAARGAVERALGDKASARTSFSRALSIDPNNSDALAESTEAALSENNFQSALESANKLVTVLPNSVNAKVLLARVYAAGGKPAEALGILEKLDDKNPDVLSLRNSIAAKGTDDIETLEKQLEKDAKSPVILGRLCVLTRMSPAKALEYCRRAAEAEPANVGHAVGFGAALVQAKQFENAAALFRKLLQIEPENFTIHANLATSLFQLKNYAEAKTQYEWLVQNKPDLAIAYYFLAISHDNLGEYPEAKSNYQKFLQLADAKQNQLEIDKVNLRLPPLEKQIKQGAGAKKGQK